MRLLFDARPETMYPLGKEGFSGGSQVYIRAIAGGLAKRGHRIDVITNDLEVDEEKGGVRWWPPDYFPHVADVAIQQMHANPECEYQADALVLMTSCIDPNLGPDDAWASAFDAYPVFSEVHKRLLLETRPTVDPARVHVTGLGVNLDDYPWPVSWLPDPNLRYAGTPKVPGRMLYANDPARGLFYTLDVFDLVKQEIPHATLHVAYDFDNQLAMRRWEHSHMAQMLLDCKRRLESTPGVVNLGALTREQIIREQLECQVHCYPSDPPGRGTQTHGLTQLECAAAGAALVLSDVEAFPEVFGEGATILPTIGTYMPEMERRVTAADYAAVVIDLMTHPERWAEESKRARALAERVTWDVVLDKWERMLEGLTGEGQ